MPPVLVLALESSCDETACAVVQAVPGQPTHRLRLLSSVVASQAALHARFGGVVPEVAARKHIEQLIPVLDYALLQAGLPLSQISALAVTRGPGLIGALLVAVQAAKALAFALEVPLVGVNHLEAHLLSAFVAETEDAPPPPPFPHVGLLVSGGHTLLVYVRDFGQYEVLGSTCDDAAGEAFDKVGKMLGLGYPAGPQIDRLAEAGDPRAFALPKAMAGKNKGLAMSFSGLKTAVSAVLQKHGLPGERNPAMLHDLCASFQAAVIEQLVRKTAAALGRVPARAVVLSGGVACNRALRQAVAGLCAQAGVGFFVSSPRLCSDNAAMVAAAGYYRLSRGERADFSLNAVANLPL